jgi:hypothetical protein
MKSVLEITKEEFDQAINEEVATIMAEAEKQFRAKLDQYGIRLTDTLKDSFARFITINSATMMAQAQIEFQGYGRFQDMKKYKYDAHIPPVHELEWFVMKTGVENFAWIHSYRFAKNRPSYFANDMRTITKIAWAIAMNKRRFPDVKRGYRGSWYNETKMGYIRDVRNRLRYRIHSAIHAAIHGNLSG